uniref:Repressor protein n=1 Tax=Myoviridae sp. ctRPH1 TaxID=2826650 RepID=A0A8S5MAE8_9CAUD|nr:MAG TPA: repressor protein [Myoviridae sp. ctRPH1]
MSNVQNVDITRVKSRAKSLGISYAFLCAQLGKGKGFFNDVKRGINHIDAYELSIIAEKLHTTPEYLTGATDDPALPTPPDAPAQPSDAVTPEQLASLDPATRKIADLFSSLPEAERQEALHYIEYIIARSQGADTDDRR